jgi:hypothetical protein
MLKSGAGQKGERNRVVGDDPGGGDLWAHGYGVVNDAMRSNPKKSPADLQVLTTIQQNNFTPNRPLPAAH